MGLFSRKPKSSNVDDPYFYTLMESIAPSKYKYGEEDKLNEAHKEGAPKFDQAKRDITA
jgi:hypothetical protein